MPSWLDSILAFIFFSLSNINWISFTILIISHYIHSLPRLPYHPPSPLLKTQTLHSNLFSPLPSTFTTSAAASLFQNIIFLPLLPQNPVHFLQNSKDWHYHLHSCPRSCFFNGRWPCMVGDPQHHPSHLSLLQEWVTATDLLITLDRLNTFGDELFKEGKVLRSYFYAISDLSVGGR